MTFKKGSYSLRPTPTYDIDLDLPPEERWLPMINDYKEPLKNIYKKMDTMLNQRLGVAGKLGRWLIEKSINIYGESPLYYKEIKSIANELNIPVNHMILLQLCYECFSACTSIIIDQPNLPYPLHFRTMDWDDIFLKDITVNLRFMKNKKFIFEATSWVGYMGILTGVKHNVCSVSINYRRNNLPQFWKNVWNTLSYRFPVGYLVREALTHCNNYKNVLNVLETTDIIAPCYIITTGPESGSGNIIVRDRKSFETHKMDSTKNYLAQTNIDPDDININHDIMFSLARKSVAEASCHSFIELLKTSTNSVIEPIKIIEQFMYYPVSNPHNIYVNLMSPSGPEKNTYINGSWIIDSKEKWDAFAYDDEIKY